MIPSNNLSVLPFYSAISEQNARKWWIFDKIYPLYTPAWNVPPFQIMRDKSVVTEADEEIEPSSSVSIDGYILDDGTIQTGVLSCTYQEYDVTGKTQVYLENVPKPYSGSLGESTIRVACYDSDDIFLGGSVLGTDDLYTGLYSLISGTVTLRLQYTNDEVGATEAQVYTVKTIPRPVSGVTVYRKDGTGGTSILLILQINGAITVKNYGDIDVIVCNGNSNPVSLAEGQYYIVLTDGLNTWYSDVFTAVGTYSAGAAGTMPNLLKVEWYDNSDLVMDEGVISYTALARTGFKNVVYLPADLAKPDYKFDEEVEERDGYTFPMKMVSQKVYRFKFFAPEYLLDVMRFVRMADNVKIYYNDKTYSVDNFLMTPEWEDAGDVAGVDVEFRTATVAKKIGYSMTNV